MELSNILEILMMLSFGAAWPASIYKSITSRTTKGKSLPFMLVIQCGYIFGVCAKFALGSITYVVIFYFINIAMVGTDIILYFINRRNDQRAAELSSVVEE